MSEERIREEAGKHSDHQDRIVAELEPALKDAPKGHDALEIGNRDGGSALFIMYLYNPKTFVTVDVNPSPPLLADWEKTLGIKHVHYQMTQEDFTKEDLDYEYGFVFLDADHDQPNVIRDIEILKERLIVGAILVVDDVGHWSSLPEFDGLERVEYNVDEGDQPKPSGHHVIYYRKV